MTLTRNYLGCFTPAILILTISSLSPESHDNFRLWERGGQKLLQNWEMNLQNHFGMIILVLKETTNLLMFYLHLEGQTRHDVLELSMAFSLKQNKKPKTQSHKSNFDSSCNTRRDFFNPLFLCWFPNLNHCSSKAWNTPNKTEIKSLDGMGSNFKIKRCPHASFHSIKCRLLPWRRQQATIYSSFQALPPWFKAVDCWLTIPIYAQYKGQNSSELHHCLLPHASQAGYEVDFAVITHRSSW